ncbi:O-antigen polymerase [Acinetobacter johnsonii]|uniref:O-antigen polymerase n=1 Tax=Acinetobacter johnsonii TaxID=40214 RepID=UPI003AF60431
MMYNLFLKKLFTYPIAILSLVIYIYFLKINFLPFYLIIPYFLLGSVVFFYEVLDKKIVKKYFYYFIFVLLSFIWALFSYVYNSYSDLYYIKETLLIGLIYFFSAFGIKKIFNFLDLDFNFEGVLKFSILAVLFQLLISLFANLFPTILSFFISIFNIDGLSLEAMNSFMEARFVGIGASFFGSGVITSFFLILLSFFINQYCKGRRYLLYFFIYMFFVVVGLLFSRTTIIGVLLSFIFFLNSKNIVKCVIIIFPMLFLSFFVIKGLFSINEKFSFGFDFLFNFKNSQASSSVGDLAEMYKVTPENIETWFFGDSKYKNFSNGDFIGYYKDTDIGYFRIIFSNGIVGLFIFILLNIYLLFKSFPNKFLFLLLFLCLLILNVKGVAHVYFFSFLFFVINNPNQLNFRERKPI